MGTALAPVYRKPLAVWADKYLFVVLFFMGSVALIVMKQLGFSQLLVTTVPVAAIVLYGAYVLLTPKYSLPSDRAGDSLYYLGFLYTMVSLAYSLYEFSGAHSTQTVVTNFGIALATTILGLTLRVVYHQLRSDPFDIEREAGVELAQTASKLHGVVLKATSDFDSLRVALSQVMNEALADAKTRLADISKEIADRSKIQQEFLTTFSKGAAEELVNHHKEMLLASRGLTAAVKACADRLAALDIPSNLIRERLDRVEIPANIIKDRLEQVEIPKDTLKQRLDVIAAQLQTLLDGLTERASRESTIMQTLYEVIQRASDAAQKLNQAVTKSGLDAEEQRAQVKAGLAMLNETLRELGSSTRSIVETNKAHLEHQQKFLNELSNTSAGALSAVEEHRRLLQSELKSSAAAVGQVHASLVSLTKTVVEKLNGRS